MSSNTNRFALAVCGLLTAALPVLAGCGYGEVSDGAYEHATALYAICNRRDASRLEQYAVLLSAAREQGDITEQEADWLAEIVDQARNDEWETAMSQARRMLADQVQRN